MVELARKKQGTRDERYLRVLKLRGSNYLEGLHAFRITRDGLDVFPRLTSPELPPTYAIKEARLSTGVPGLDKMLAGRRLGGQRHAALGPTGAGKTTLALQFVLEGLKRGEPGIYVNFQENPTQLARSIESLGWDMAEAQRRGCTCSTPRRWSCRSTASSSSCSAPSRSITSSASWSTRSAI